jgi:hypothetical protein
MMDAYGDDTELEVAKYAHLMLGQGDRDGLLTWARIWRMIAATHLAPAGLPHRDWATLISSTSTRVRLRSRAATMTSRSVVATNPRTRRRPKTPVPPDDQDGACHGCSPDGSSSTKRAAIADVGTRQLSFRPNRRYRFRAILS